MKDRTLSFAARSEMLPFGATPGRRAAALGALLTLAPASGVLAQQQHSLPLVNAADRSQQGFVRIINRSDRSGRVTIVATDDSGNRSASVTLSMGALETRHFNSGDLENGHANRLPGSGVGDGDGDWRLELTSELEIEPLAYIRTSTGFVTSMHDVVQGETIPLPDSTDVHAIRYHVRFFNPKHATAPGSRLRLINTSNLENVVTITGLDDHGNSPPGGAITVTLPAYGARTITSAQLEDGDSGFQGSFGDGFNKWQLFVAPQVGTNGHLRPIQVMTMLHQSSTGLLTNLSTTGLGNDPNTGGDGVDFLNGGPGDDVLNPGTNDDAWDVVFGSAGNDRIVYSDSGPTAYQALNYRDLGTGITATINGATNSATVTKGSMGTDTVVDVATPLNAAGAPPYGGFGIAGSGRNDTFVLTTDEDGQSMDVRGEAGNDRIDIRSGTVAVNYRTSTQGIHVDLATGRVSNDGFGGVDTIIGDVRELIGGDGNDTLLGTDGSDRLDGRDGDDVINPRANDRSSDNIYASVGNDRVIYSDSGPDSYQALWYSRPWRSALTPLDDAGVDVTINGAANSATADKGSAGTDTIVDINQPLTGWGFGLHGTKGDDTFDLSLDHGQWMQVQGGAGDDTFNLRTIAWESDEREGSSIRIDYSHSENGIDLDLGNGTARDDGFGDVDTITLGDGWHQVQGSDFSDRIRGSDNSEDFIGRQGDDNIDGRGGSSDRLRFDRECCATIRDLTVNLYTGTATGVWNDEPFSYTIANIERVRGTNNDDELIGSNGANRLEGRGGDDTLNSYGGDDQLWGGAGEDTFVFDRGDGHDRIYDFTDGDDLIVLLDLGITSKQQVLDNAYAWDTGTGVHIDLTGFGGGRIDLHGFHRDLFDASDFLI